MIYFLVIWKDNVRTLLFFTHWSLAGFYFFTLLNRFFTISRMFRVWSDFWLCFRLVKREKVLKIWVVHHRKRRISERRHMKWSLHWIHIAYHGAWWVSRLRWHHWIHKWRRRIWKGKWEHKGIIRRWLIIRHYYYLELIILHGSFCI